MARIFKSYRNVVECLKNCLINLFYRRFSVEWFYWVSLIPEWHILHGDTVIGMRGYRSVWGLRVGELVISRYGRLALQWLHRDLFGVSKPSRLRMYGRWRFLILLERLEGNNGQIRFDRCEFDRWAFSNGTYRFGIVVVAVKHSEIIPKACGAVQDRLLI